MKDFKVVFIYPNLRGMNTPQFPKEKIKGLVRTFSFFIYGLTSFAGRK